MIGRTKEMGGAFAPLVCRMKGVSDGINEDGTD